ncbi:MAG: glycosyltransferase family 39 protein [Gemmatimonadota bacterium]|nr:MAG: glycosyltransferase family 39 protein [Gemmatimonadota bacterium]
MITHKHILCLVIILAAAIRIIYMFEYRFNSPFYDYILLDSEVYDTAARTIASGEWIGAEPFYTAPLYPYLLAVIYKFLSDEHLLVYLFQTVLGFLNLGILYFIGKKAFNKNTGLIAFIIALLYPTFLFYETKLMATTLAVFLSLLVLLWFMKVKNNPKRIYWMIGGVLLGLSLVNRPANLLFLGFILVWIWIGFSVAIKRKLIFTSFLILGFCVSVGPVTLRNYLVSNDFVLVSSQGGITFYQGNNPRAKGLYVSLSEFSGSPLTQGQEEKKLAEKALGRSLKRSEVIRYWSGKGIQFILEDPLRYMKLEVMKVYRFLNNFEYSTEYNLSTEREYIKTLRLLFIPYAFIISFGLYGLLVSRQHWRKLTLLYFFLTANFLVMMLFFVSSRYRLPAVSILIPFAAFGISDMYERLRGKAGLSRFALMILVLLFFLLSVSKIDNAHKFQLGGGHYNLGNHFFDKKEYGQAIKEYKKNLEINPRSLSTLYNLGNTYSMSGRMDEALDTYKEVVKIKSHFKKARLKMARIYEKKGKTTEAIREYRAFLEKQPDNKEAREALQRLQGSMNNLN